MIKFPLKGTGTLVDISEIPLPPKVEEGSKEWTVQEINKLNKKISELEDLIKRIPNIHLLMSNSR